MLNLSSLWRLLEKPKLPSELLKCTLEFSKICLFTFHIVTLLVEEPFDFYSISMCFPVLSSPFVDQKGQIIGLASGLGVEETYITFGHRQ